MNCYYTVETAQEIVSVHFTLEGAQLRARGTKGAYITSRPLPDLLYAGCTVVVVIGIGGMLAWRG